MHPVLFEIAGHPVYSYGVMLGTSLIVAWYTVMYLGTRKEELTTEVMGTTFILTAISAIFFARLLFVLTNLEHFQDPLDFFAFRQGGLVAYGGFLGGLLGSWLYLRSKKVSLLGWADVVAPTLGIGLGFTRIGCYLYGCDFGAPLEESAPSWLRDLGTFPRWTEAMVPVGEVSQGSAAWHYHVEAYEHSPLSDFSLAVHPTQLYESLVGFALAGVALYVWRSRHFRGQVILTLTFLYGIWRFLIEYVRDDPERGFYLGFSTSQWISLALVPFAAFMYFSLRKKQGESPFVPRESASGNASRDESAPPKSPSSKAPSPKKKRKRRKG